MERDIFLFRPLKGRYVWLAPMMYVTAVALFVGPLLSKIGVFSYTVGLLFVLLSFSLAVFFFTFFLTKDPDATKLFSPKVILGNIVALVPTEQFFISCQFPAIDAEHIISVPVPKIQSCSIKAEVFITE